MKNIIFALIGLICFIIETCAYVLFIITIVGIFLLVPIFYDDGYYFFTKKIFSLIN